MKDLEELLRHGHKIADEMGRISTALYSSQLAVEMKIDRSPVTEADRKAEQAARNYLVIHRPQDKVWGEEFGKTFDRPSKDDITWIFDPIDGTRGFIARIPIWTNLVSAFQGERLLFGIINNPTTGERLCGGPNVPSRYSYIDQATNKHVEIPVLASDAVALHQLVWGSTTKNYMDAPDRKAFDVLAKISTPSEGGDAMLYVWLALGKLNAVYDGDMSPWDIAAPAGVVLGAKRIVTDAYGRPLDFFRQGKTTVLATATQPLHEEVLAVLTEARRPELDAKFSHKKLNS